MSPLNHERILPPNGSRISMRSASHSAFFPKLQFVNYVWDMHLRLFAEKITAIYRSDATKMCERRR